MNKAPITAITELEENSYKTKVFAGGHFIYADEPESLGGKDEGMTPGALLLASLGSCTAITIKMYANRKEWDVQSIKIHLEICAENDMDKHTTIERKLEINGNLSDEERTRLFQIADKCPIHKILSNPIHIITK